MTKGTTDSTARQKVLKKLHVLRSEGQISTGKESSQSDVSSIKNKPQMRSTLSHTASRKWGFIALVSCFLFGYNTLNELQPKGRKMTLEQMQEWVIKGTGAGQELGSNTCTEEGWNCSVKSPSGRSGREIIILKLMLSINWLGINGGCNSLIIRL